MDPGEVFDSWLEGGIDRTRQVDAGGVHLTVAEVLHTHAKGRIDFGGSELQPASTHPEKFFERSMGDKYSWWRLDEGTYVVRFNERLREEAPLMLLLSNDRILDCGAFVAPRVCAAGEIRTLLHVPKCGLNVKQNARIALLRSPA